jgi:pimeloyl-ACP methyl ester carboxylesterase
MDAIPDDDIVAALDQVVVAHREAVDVDPLPQSRAVQSEMTGPERGAANQAARNDPHESLEVLAADLAHVVDTVASVERRAVIVGESFGGAVALTFALGYPKQVGALVILNSFPYFAPQVRLRLAIAGLTVLPWGAMPLVRHLTAFRLHSPHTHRAEVKQFIELTSRATRDGYINRLKLLRRFDVRDRLRDILEPALFLAAEHDHLVPSVAQARYMADRVPSSVLRILRGHGHICLIAPDVDLAQILDEWQAGSDRR